MQAAILGDVKDVVPQEFHEQVKDMYSWQDVARRTCKVRAAPHAMPYASTAPYKLIICAFTRLSAHVFNALGARHVFAWSHMGLCSGS